MFALHPASDRKRSSGFATGDVQDTAPVPVHEPVGASCETVAELPVQAVSLPALHGDMPGERVQQLDVALGVVDGLDCRRKRCHPHITRDDMGGPQMARWPPGTSAAAALW